MTAHLSEPEFNPSIRVEDVGTEGLELDLIASPTERAALAARFGLLECLELTGHARVVPIHKPGFFRLSVDFKANVLQSCVVTLEPVTARIEDRFELVYGPVGEVVGESGEVDVSLEDEDPPEALSGGTIQVGEAVIEHLALAMDPYPRKPGVEWDAAMAGAEDAEPGASSGPFAALNGLSGAGGQREDETP